MGDQGGQTTTSTQESAPWAAMQPFMKDVWGQAQQQFGTPIQQYGGQRIGGQSAQTLESQQAGLGMIRGAGGGAGGEYIQNLLGGQFLSPDSNPYLRQMAEQGASDITRQFKTATAPGLSMAGIGRAGSGAEANLYGQGARGLGDALAANYANTYGQNYARERGFQQQGIGLASQFGANRRADIGFGSQMGMGADIYQQRLADEDIRRFNFGQQEPGQRLDDYVRHIMGGGVVPGTTTSETTQYGGGGMTPGQWAGLGVSTLGMFMSSRAFKNEHSTVDHVEALKQLEHLPIAIWDYTAEHQKQMVEAGHPADSAMHLGPYAEDFQSLLGLGDGKTIAFIDIIGFALAATKGAGEHIRELATSLADARERLAALEGVIGKPSHLQEVPA